MMAVIGACHAICVRPSRAAPFGIAIAGGLVVVCGGESGNPDSGARGGLDDRIRIATTIYPVEYFVARVGGDSVEIVNLIPPGVEAHDFDPKVSDFIDIAQSDLIIYNGAEFEPWVERALDALGGDAPPSVEAIELLGADLLPAGDQDNDQTSEPDKPDPHVWLSPLKAISQVDSIIAALSAAKPESASVFEASGERLTEELEFLDVRLSEGLSDCRLSTFVTSHAAYAYLADEYGLEQVAVAGLSPDAEPKPRTLAKISNLMADLKVSYVLVEPIANSRLGKTLARETGGATLPLHPLESLTQEESDSGADYFSIMNQNLESLAVALDCN